MKQQIKTIMPEKLATETLNLKNEGYRLLAITCTYNAGFELSYSFDKENNDKFCNLRFVTDIGTPIESISNIFLCAFLYENEIKELFGINIVNIAIDFKNNLYKIAAKTPFNVQGEEK